MLRLVSSRNFRLVLFILALVSWFLGWSFGEEIGGARYDALVFHWQAAKTFATEPLFPSLANYSSATTPLFHLLMAYTIDTRDYSAYRVASFVLASSAIVALGAALHRRFHPVWGDTSQVLLIVGALLLSPSLRSAAYWGTTDAMPLFFLAFAVWLLTDSATGGWRNEISALRTLLLILVSAAAFYTRQHYAAVPVLTFLVLFRRSALHPVLLVAAFSATFLPALALFLSWHGLTPPLFQRQQKLAFLNFMIVGAAVIPVALPFFLSHPARPLLVRIGAGASAGLAVGFAAVMILPIKIYSLGGGVLAKVALMLGPRAGVPLLAAFAGIGWCAIASLARRRLDDAIVITAAVIPLILGSPFYQRYSDPFGVCVLMLLAAPQTARTITNTRTPLILYAYYSVLFFASFYWFMMLEHLPIIPKWVYK